MDLNKIKVRRSFIFTPGLNPEMFPKALASGADMVCIELEDGIAIKDKDEARKNTINALKTLKVKFLSIFLIISVVWILHQMISQS